MPAGHQRRGVTALLFDRLVRREEGAATPPSASRGVYDLDALQDSIAEQVSWLLNTRVPIDYPTLDARTRAAARTTVDYGLPDLTVYPLGDADARARLHAHLAQTIALYEPRLQNPRVVLSPANGREQTLQAEIAGTVRIGLLETPIRFRVAIDAGREDRSGE